MNSRAWSRESESMGYPGGGERYIATSWLLGLAALLMALLVAAALLRYRKSMQPMQQPMQSGQPMQSRQPMQSGPVVDTFAVPVVDAPVIDTEELTIIGNKNVCGIAADQMDQTCDGDANVKDFLFFGDAALKKTPTAGNNQSPYYMGKIVSPSDGTSSLQLNLNNRPSDSFWVGGGHKFRADGTAAIAGSLVLGDAACQTSSDRGWGDGGSSGLSIYNRHSGGWTKFPASPAAGSGGHETNLISGHTYVSGRLKGAGLTTVHGSGGSGSAAAKVCVDGACMTPDVLRSMIYFANTVDARLKNIELKDGKQDSRLEANRLQDDAAESRMTTFAGTLADTESAYQKSIQSMWAAERQAMVDQDRTTAAAAAAAAAAATAAAAAAIIAMPPPPPPPPTPLPSPPPPTPNPPPIPQQLPQAQEPQAQEPQAQAKAQPLAQVQVQVQPPKPLAAIPSVHTIPYRLLGVGNDYKLYTKDSLSSKWAPVADSCCIKSVTQVFNGTKPDGGLIAGGGMFAGIGTDDKLYIKATLTSPWKLADNSCCVAIVTELNDHTLLAIGTDTRTSQFYTKATYNSPWVIAGANTCCVISITQLRDGSFLGVGADYKLYTKSSLSAKWVGPMADSCCVVSVVQAPDGVIYGVGTNQKLYTKKTFADPWVYGGDNTCCVIGITILTDLHK